MNRGMRMIYIAAMASVVIGGSLSAQQAVKLYVPYSKLTDLSEDQQKQISAIEVDYRARIKQLEDEKDAKIVALLTEPQKAALKKMDDDEKAKRKTYLDKKKAADKSKPGADKE